MECTLESPLPIASSHSPKRRRGTKNSIVKKPKKRSLKRKADWNCLGNEIWEHILINLDGVSLFSFTFLNHRFKKLATENPVLWSEAYERSLPRTFHAFCLEPKTFEFASLEGRLYLKSMILYERTYYKWRSSPEFKPYLLKSTGLSPRAFLSTLPKNRQLSETLSQIKLKNKSTSYTEDIRHVADGNADQREEARILDEADGSRQLLAQRIARVPTLELPNHQVVSSLEDGDAIEGTRTQNETSSSPRRVVVRTPEPSTPVQNLNLENLNNNMPINAEVELEETRRRTPRRTATPRVAVDVIIASSPLTDNIHAMNDAILETPSSDTLVIGQDINTLHHQVNDVQQDRTELGQDTMQPQDAAPAVPVVAPVIPKRLGKLRRSLAKLRSVVGLVQGTSRKVVENQENEAAEVTEVAPVPKRSSKMWSGFKNKNSTLKFEMKGGSEQGGVDEAWFGLMATETVQQPSMMNGDSPSRRRGLTEISMLINVLSSYPNNAKVQSAGSYAIRRLCYFPQGSPPDYVNEIETNRAKLASGPVVDILLAALQTFKKDTGLIARIFVALGNLALHSANAIAIGDRGLPLIIKLLKKYKRRAEVTDYGIFLLQNVADGRVEYKKKLRDLGVISFIQKEVHSFVTSITSHAGGKSQSSKSRRHSVDLTGSLAPAIAAQQAEASSDSSSYKSAFSVDPDTSEDSDHISADDVNHNIGHRNNEGGADDEALSEDVSAWALKRRPAYNTLVTIVPRLAADLALIRRLLDLLCILGSDYDIIRTESALQFIHLVGDCIVTLFGFPSVVVAEVLASAMKCLLVIYEWDVQHRDWSYSSFLVETLLIEAKACLNAGVHLNYISNCYLVIFSLVWKREDQNVARRRLIDLIIGNMKISGSDDDMLRAGAAMLGDLAHSFYELRIHIRDIGGVKLLKSIDPSIYRDPSNLAAILDEFNDRPLAVLPVD